MIARAVRYNENISHCNEYYFKYLHDFSIFIYFFINSLSKDRQRSMHREAIAIAREDLLELQLSQIAGDGNLREMSIVQKLQGSERCRSSQEPS